ncbi:hypothetical protein THASP1DRAFT_27210 [Thamnocephalis sphaerospora]|uniref:Uncharacterized protein n=1 Tax=Thamnocephalis sphaerospora TaxID=78915 RepID=A0A4P9XXJ0_9FUNG|nr:hypothetical protein THASP1DRAFT_27210 [Thamnocephalis sphaerospora]|eukprot:RKP11037.1 hypothetical protein THASP1DRAFT_27210 [Thamnocephalis sphaerospora]
MSLKCPLCGSPVAAIPVNLDEYFTMCKNASCPFPLNEQDIAAFFAPAPTAVAAGKRKKPAA